MNLGNLLTISVVSIFINNFVLSRFLGLCPYVGVSKKLDSAVGMGMAVMFVMSLASVFTWLVYTYFLNPEGTFGPENSEWKYNLGSNPMDFYSPILSSAQRLPNGNTLICEGVKGYFF